MTSASRGKSTTTVPLPDWVKSLQKNVLPPVVAIFCFMLIWQLFSTKEFPGPIKVLQDSFTLSSEGVRLIDPFYRRSGLDDGLFWQVLNSLKRVGIGYTLAALFGVATGILVGANQMVYRGLDPIFQFLRTVPPLAWVPISLAALRDNQLSALFVIFITAIWPILINTAVGVRQIPQDYNNVARVLRLPGHKYFFKVLFPAALPYIITGMRIGVGLSWLAIIAAEIVMSGVPGIGFFIWDSYQNNAVTAIILALFYIGAFGLMLDRLVAFVGSLIVPEQR